MSQNNNNNNPMLNKASVPQNPILNHPLIPKNNNQNNNNANNNNDIIMADETNKMSEEEKKEIEAENDIRDKLKCYICLSKVNKPKMCKYCKRLSCSDCIKTWLSQHDFCGICKKSLTNDDVISVPFLDNMSTYFINNIENNPKHQLEKIEKPKNKIKSEDLRKIKNMMFVIEL